MLKRPSLKQRARRRASEVVDVLEAELKRASYELAALEADQVETLRRGRQARANTTKLDAFLNAHGIALEIQQKLRRDQKLKDDLDTAIANLEHARTTRVVLPEDFDGEDYERKLAEALGRIEGSNGFAATPTVAAPMADELAVPDVAELYGVQPMQARRWRAGTSNPPIDPDAWIKINEKNWRYPVSAIDERALARIPADDPRAALDSIRRKRAALGFGRRNGHKKPETLSSVV